MSVKENRPSTAAAYLDQTTIECSSDAIFWVDIDARIVRVNAAACAMHGYEKADFEKLAVFDLTDEYTDETWPSLWLALREAGSVRMESHHIRADNTRFPVEAAVFYVLSDGVEFCAAFIRDISERREREAALASAHREIEKLKNRLAAAGANPEAFHQRPARRCPAG